MKTIVSLLITFLLSVISYAQTFTVDGLDYEVTSTNPNEVQITGGTPATSDLVIPETVSDNEDTFSVVRVKNSAFEGAGLTSVTFPNTIRFIDDLAFQNNQLTSISLPNGLTGIGFSAFRSNAIGGALVIPNSVVIIRAAGFADNQINSITISKNMISLRRNTFSNNNLASVIIPSGITSIGVTTFELNPLTQVTSLAITPPSIVSGNEDSFRGIRSNINLTLPQGTTSAYEAAGWTGFASTSEFDFDFEQDCLFYKIVSTNPNEVEIVKGAATRDFEIPETVPNEGINYTVTSIGNRAFEFANIVNLTIPASVNNIESVAFNANGSMRTVSLLNPNLPFLQISGFSNRRNIQLTVPEASLNGYINSSLWNSSTNDNDPQSAEDSRRFFSINSVYTSTIGRGGIASNLIYRNINRNQAINKVLIRSKNTGSLPSDFVIPDNFMIRGINFIITEIDANALDNEGLVNVTLPSGLESIGSFAFGDNPLETITTTGPDAIVDWVLVELRSGADNENTTVVTSQAAFIQRDGDIVGLDGTSTITFTEDAGDYFIAIKHRNHIGILAAVPAPLSGTATTVDFTQDVTVAKGENLALTQVNGTFAMIAGDADGSSQILNTDITEGLTLAGGGESYANADADMNGFVLNSDIQLLILGNSGTVQQFE